MKQKAERKPALLHMIEAHWEKRADKTESESTRQQRSDESLPFEKAAVLIFSAHIPQMIEQIDL